MSEQRMGRRSPGNKKLGQWNILDGLCTRQEKVLDQTGEQYFAGPGWIYAIREDGTPLVKIGLTRQWDVKFRLRCLWATTHIPLTLIAAVYTEASALYVERQLHAHPQAAGDGQLWLLSSNAASRRIGSGFCNGWQTWRRG